MAQTKETPAAKETDAANKMTIAEALKLVKRSVPVIKDGKQAIDGDGNPVFKEVAIKPEEVLAYADHGTYVNVVTKDGQKFRGDK